jgi:NitT/TauT family transport system substrate-binding protein
MKNVWRMGRLRLTALTAVAALASVAAAGATSAAPVSHSARADAGTITLGLPGIPPVFLGVRPYVASQKGLYSKYGVNVQLKQFTTGTDAMRAVQNGQIDAAWAPTPTALNAIAQGAPLVGIEGMDVVDWEIGSIDGSIKSCDQLKGQTIGVDTVGGARYNALIGMLSKCKLTINDVKTVNFPGAAGMNAQIAGQLPVNVDHVDEVSQIEASGKPVTIVAKLTDVDPYQHYDMLVTTRNNVKAHYYDFVHMIEGDIAASKWMSDPKNLDEAAQIATITGDSQPVAKGAIQHYLSIKWWPYTTSGLTVQRITRTIGLYTKLGQIPASADLTFKGVTDTRMWKQANAAINHIKPKKKK